MIPRRRSKLHRDRVSVYKNYYNYRICISESDNFNPLGFNRLYYYYYNYYNYYIYLHVIRGLKNERKLEKISIFIIIE